MGKKIIDKRGIVEEHHGDGVWIDLRFVPYVVLKNHIFYYGQPNIKDVKGDRIALWHDDDDTLLGIDTAGSKYALIRDSDIKLESAKLEKAHETIESLNLKLTEMQQNYTTALQEIIVLKKKLKPAKKLVIKTQNKKLESQISSDEVPSSKEDISSST